MIRSQAGYSLVEALFALIILTVGVLAAARSLAAVNHSLASGSVLTRVAVLGVNRVETLLASGCVGVAEHGEGALSGVRLRWDSRRVAQARDIVVVVNYPLNYEQRVDSLGLYVTCPDGP